jgi:uncharacterized alkaline shock family protein YloU
MSFDYEDNGRLKISDEVLATIAGIAASEVKGVAGLSSRTGPEIKGILQSKKGPGKAIRLEIKDGEANFEVFVNLYMGAKIPDVAAEIQSRVKESVQNMTGITVSKVNVHVSSVVIEKEAQAQE